MAARKKPTKKKAAKKKQRKPRSRSVTARDLEPIYPWERQPGESAKAFAAFEHYLGDGSQNRTLRKTKSAIGKAWSLICAWSIKHDWVKRAEAKDRYDARREQAAWDSARDRMNERQANNAMAAMGAAMATLSKFVPTKEHPNPPPLRERDAIRLFAVAARLERVARGEPDMIQKTTGEVKITSSPDDMRASMLKVLEDPQGREHMAAISKLMGTDGSNGSRE